MNQKEWAEIIKKEIEAGDLYGSSFVDGVALYRIIKRVGNNDEAAADFMEQVEARHGVAMRALESAGIDPQNAQAWAELLDINKLDGIARDLSGEDEEGGK